MDFFACTTLPRKLAGCSPFIFSARTFMIPFPPATTTDASFNSIRNPPGIPIQSVSWPRIFAISAWAAFRLVSTSNTFGPATAVKQKLSSPALRAFSTSKASLNCPIMVSKAVASSSAIAKGPRCRASTSLLDD